MGNGNEMEENADRDGSKFIAHVYLQKWIYFKKNLKE